MPGFVVLLCPLCFGFSSFFPLYFGALSAPSSSLSSGNIHRSLYAFRLLVIASYFTGLRAVIVDFKGKPSYPAAHLPLADFLRCYFAEAAAFKAGGKYPYLSFASSWRSPLYFQHQGHSRTVIGLQQVSEKDYHLLVLDPASRSKAVSVIKSNSLKKSDYQLLFMLERRDEGIVMSTQERERSKDLSRSHLYLVENGIMRNVS